VEAHTLHTQLLTPELLTDNQATATLYSTLCKSRSAHILPASLDVASACDADRPPAASMKVNCHYSSTIMLVYILGLYT
jgi:hypothetical protein